MYEKIKIIKSEKSDLIIKIVVTNIKAKYVLIW